MLDLMRKHARNWIMKVLLGIIIIVFIFYFGSVGGKRQAETVATINGKAIAYVDVVKEYQNLIQVYRQRLGSALTDETIKKLNLKQAALDNLIQQAIILQKAKETGLTISDEEVRASILAMPAFQRGGVFDERIYQQALRFNKVTPEDFEQMQKHTLIMSLFLNLIQDSVRVSDQEVLDIYRFQKEKVNLYYLQVSPDAFRSRVVSKEEELEAYLKEHAASFRVPDQIQVKYLHFRAEDYASTVNVTDAEIADYYDRHADQFKTAKGKRQALSEVKTKIAAQIRQFGSMQTAADEAKKAHNTIYQEENFEGYAAKNRLAIKTTGFFAAGAIPAELRGIGDGLQTIFSFNKDEISRVLSDQKSYYLIKVTAKNPAYTPSLKDIRAQVVKKVIDREAERMAQQEAESLLAAIKQGKSIRDVAAQRGLGLAETGFFQAGEGSPKLGTSVEIKSAVFQLTDKFPVPDRIFNVNSKFLVLQLKERSKPDDSGFAANRDQLKAAILQGRKNDIVKSWLDDTKAAMLKEGKLKVLKDVKDL
jgi:peptidyl-prolyl cis-trans isomerase D